MKSVLFMLLASLTCVFTSFSQVKNEPYSTADYLSDFDFMVELVKKQHPNPFRFITEEAFDEKASALRKQLKNDPTFVRFILGNPLNLIADTHLSLSPDPLFYEAYVKEIVHFPLQTIVYNNRVFVNQYTLAVPLGAELIRINNIEVSDLLDQIPSKVDGNIQATTQKEFTDYLPFLLPQATAFDLVYKESNSKELKNIHLAGVPFVRYDYNKEKTIIPQVLLGSKMGIYGYQLDENTYRLNIQSFNLSEEYAYYILNTIFTEIKTKNIEHLILDIRDNAGGSLSNIPLFYSFISPSKTFKNAYKYATKVPAIQVKNHLVDEDGKALSTSEIITIDNFMRQRFDKNEADGFYYGNNRLEEYYIENYPQDKNAFQGTVVLLQNNNTISAAAYFASLFQLNKRGLLVGQETGSCKNFTTAAWFLNYKLPHTGTLISMPRSEIFFNTGDMQEKACSGVLPDYTLTADQFQEGLEKTQDAEFDLAFELIKAKSRPSH